LLRQLPLIFLCLPGRAPFLPIESIRVGIAACNWHESCAKGGMHKKLSSLVLRPFLSVTIVEHAILVAALARPLLECIQRKDKDLASQVRRAISSIALNAAEAHGNSGGNTRVRFESALGSLYEAKAGIQLAIAWGYISEAAAAEAVESMNCLGGRLFGLCRR
jgi:four helix bundle protein